MLWRVRTFSRIDQGVPEILSLDFVYLKYGKYRNEAIYQSFNRYLHGQQRCIIE